MSSATVKLASFARTVLLLAAGGVAALATAAHAETGRSAVDLTTLTSPFWTSYNKYIVAEAKAQGIDLLEPFNSEFDTAKQITGVQNAIKLGAKGIIFSPFESAAAGTVLKTAEKAGVAVVAVDVAPTTGPVAIVVRANNLAYGEKACKYIGEHVPEGPVVQIMGDQASINGRDRGNGFRECITKNYPKLKLLEIPTKAWSGEDAAAGLDAMLNSTPDLKAIYMHAGGVFLAPTLQTLQRKGMLNPAGEPGHIVIVSNDGIPQEYDAIRKGEIDATVSQPADLYAKYGLDVPEGGDRRARRSSRPDRPRQHHRRGRPGRPRGPAGGAARHQGERRRQEPLGQPAQAVPGPMAPPEGRTPIVEAVGVVQALRPDGRAERRRSGCCPASPTRWSGATAPASRRWWRSSPACSAPDAGEVRFSRRAGAADRPTATRGGGGSPASTSTRPSSPSSPSPRTCSSTASRPARR